MIRLSYVNIDVFTANALEGNQLAVFTDASALSTEQMQRIAKETNYSETTFVIPRSFEETREKGNRVRIFTTTEELPFAGHPTLGTAWVLRGIGGADEIVLDLNVGKIHVRFSTLDGQPFGEMTQRDPEFGAELDRAEVARLTGLTVSDLHPSAPPQVVSTGTAFAIVPLCSAEALARLNVLQQEATPWLRARGARWFYVLGPTGATEPDYRARMQFNGGEDPATGSAAGCAISYLVARDLVESGIEIHVRQGVEILRPSELYLHAKRSGATVNNVGVSGSTVLVAKGRLFLP